MERERERERCDGTETKEMIPRRDVSCICETGSYWGEIECCRLMSKMIEILGNREVGRGFTEDGALCYFHEVLNTAQRLLKTKPPERQTDVVRHE